MTWRPAPLKRFLQSNDSGAWGNDPEPGQLTTQVVRSTDIRLDGSWDLTDVAERQLTDRDRKRTRLEAGDLVMVTSSGSADHLGKTAIVDEFVAEKQLSYSNFVQRLRASEDGEPRYLRYFLSSSLASFEIRRMGTTSTGLRNLSGGLLGSVVCPGPPIVEQRRIADFLDDETARIDALIAVKQQMLSASAERLAASRESVLWSGGHHADLRHLIDPTRPVTYGIVLPGPNVEGPDTVPIVKGGDVARNFSRPLNRTTAEIESPYRRSRLAAGDIVMSIRGGIGDVASVPSWADGANLTQDAARIAPAPWVNAAWLLHVLASPGFQRQVELMRTGSSVTGVNISDIKRMKVPSVSAEVAASSALLLDAQAAQHDALVMTLTMQVGLLRERRQALITAAVTGDIEV